jgi:ribulose-phosphate 3-epimerase
VTVMPAPLERARSVLSLPRVAPSILAADFARLGAQVEEVMDAGARVLHVDVMDGHFVPPITMGALVVDALRQTVTEGDGILDVHLMVDRPERHVAAFAAAGADIITVHQEATPHVDFALRAVRDAGCLAGLALNPGTAACAAAAIEVADVVLCMTVNPGWGGQAFLDSTVPKLHAVRKRTPAAVLEVDGGIAERTARACAGAGATLLVAGSAIFGAPDPGGAYRAIADAAAAS